MKIKTISNDIFNLAHNVYKELGGGFNEAVLQKAFAIELREAKIKYLQEVNIEIFYKGHSIGTDRPDFLLLTPAKSNWALSDPLILETKWSNKLTNDNRMQLKSYFKSLPRNKNSTLHKATTLVPGFSTSLESGSLSPVKKPAALLALALLIQKVVALLLSPEKSAENQTKNTP